MPPSKLLKDFGCYYPSFFQLKINSSEKPDEFIGSSHEATLTHELIHFLQDITTTYGLINISNNIDSIKAINVHLRKSCNKALAIPYIFDDSHSVATNRDLFSIYIGQGAECLTSVDNHGLKSVHQRKELIKADDMNLVFEFSVFLEFKDITKKFHFGSMAIMESMAHALENYIHHKNDNSLRFPYDSARLVAEFYLPYFEWNDLFIAELCEVALMFYNPAIAFIRILQAMRKDSFVPANANDIMSYTSSSFKFCTADNPDGIPLRDVFDEASKNAIKQLDDLFTAPPYKTEKWASGLIEKAKTFKPNNESLVSLIDSKERRDSFYKLIKKIGIPPLYNNENQIGFMEEYHKLKTPFLFPAINAFFQLMVDYAPPDICPSHSMCSQLSSNFYNVDESCREPWRRASMGKKCPFSLLWKMWGLKDANVVRK